MQHSNAEDVSVHYKQDGKSVDMVDNTVFPTPVAKEFILRAVDPRPAPYSETLPHRMYCTLIDGKEYRLAGAFSSDTIFL